MQYSTVQYFVVQFSAVHCSTFQCITVQCSAVESRVRDRGRQFVAIVGVLEVSKWLIPTLAYTHPQKHLETLFLPKEKQKSRMWETPTLSTDADSRTDTNLKRLRDLSQKEFFF